MQPREQREAAQGGCGPRSLPAEVGHHPGLRHRCWHRPLQALAALSGPVSERRTAAVVVVDPSLNQLRYNPLSPIS